MKEAQPLNKRASLWNCLYQRLHPNTRVLYQFINNISFWENLIFLTVSQNNSGNKILILSLCDINSHLILKDSNLGLSESMGKIFNHDPGNFS